MLRPCRRTDLNAGHRDACSDSAVVTAAGLLAELRTPEILGFATTQLIARLHLHAAKAAALESLAWDASDPRTARVDQLAEACFLIATESHERYGDSWPGLRRGALLEELVQDLLTLRPLVVHREVRFSLGGWESGCQDLVGLPSDGSDPHPVEVYECKTEPADLVQDDIDELDQIVDRTAHLGDPLAAVATWRTPAYLDEMLEGLSVPLSLRRVTQTDIFQLITIPPTALLAPRP
jgi:hypothetical protein